MHKCYFVRGFSCCYSLGKVIRAKASQLLLLLLLLL